MSVFSRIIDKHPKCRRRHFIFPNRLDKTEEWEYIHWIYSVKFNPNTNCSFQHDWTATDHVPGMPLTLQQKLFHSITSHHHHQPCRFVLDWLLRNIFTCFWARGDRNGPLFMSTKSAFGVKVPDRNCWLLTGDVDWQVTTWCRAFKVSFIYGPSTHTSTNKRFK